MKTWEKIKQNPDLLSKYLVREKVVDTIREFFKGEGFHEIQTPILVPMPSTEPNLEVFETQLRTNKDPMGKRAFLITSPEFALKKLIAAGVGSVFEITRSFRNEEEMTPSHNPEFSILEWYKVGADYMKIAEDFEKLFLEIINKTHSASSGQANITYQGIEYDLSLPWPKISFEEAFAKYAGKKIAEIKDEDFYKIFYNEVEPKLRESRKPTFIYDYPISQAALARKKESDPRFAERWEVFLAGLELGNCFSELTDAVEQDRRLVADLALRRDLGKTEYPMDTDFINALKSGMPEVAGVAVGVDRLIMLAADVPSIAETMFFPAEDLFWYNRGVENKPLRLTNEDFLSEVEAHSSEVYLEVKECFGKWKNMSSKERTMLANRLRMAGWLFNPAKGWERRHNSAAWDYWVKGIKWLHMGNINAGNAAKGMYLMYKDAPNQVLKAEFMAPGKGSPIMRIKFRNVQTGAVSEFTYKTNESIEEADVDKKEMQYLYRDGDELIFMDPKTFEQASVPVSLVEDQAGYLIADMKCYVLWYAEKAIGVVLPPHVSLKVVESPDSVAGNRVNAPKKEVKVETGVMVQVPLFIKEGEIIILDTTTGEYLSRAN